MAAALIPSPVRTPVALSTLSDCEQELLPADAVGSKALDDLERGSRGRPAWGCLRETVRVHDLLGLELGSGNPR
jgi:hypothetical protein